MMTFVEQGRSGSRLKPIGNGKSLVERDLAIGDVNLDYGPPGSNPLPLMIFVSQTDLVPDGSLRGEAASVRVRVRATEKTWRTLIAGVCEEAGEGRGTEWGRMSREVDPCWRSRRLRSALRGRPGGNELRLGRRCCSRAKGSRHPLLINAFWKRAADELAFEVGRLDDVAERNQDF